jgi:type II secretion system protein J
MNRSSRHNLRKYRSGGFSLLELILVMGVMAMLSMSLYASLSTAFKAKRTAERTVRPSRAVATALDLMGRDLEAAVMPPAVPTTGIVTQRTLAGDFYGIDDASGTGEADSIEFYSLGSDGPWEQRTMSEGVRRVIIGLRTDVNPPVLVRQITRNLTATVEEEPEEDVICRNVRSFAVRYWDGFTWYEDWDSTASGPNSGGPSTVIPLAVRVEMEVTMDGVQQPGMPANTYRVTRVIPIARAQS